MTTNDFFNPPAALISLNLVTARFFETWDFYTEHLDFRTMEESDAYVQLMHRSGARLGILRHETDERHPELVSATDGRGLWLNLVVTEVDAFFQRLEAAGAPLVQPLETGARGSRSFMVRDPNGVLIRVEQARTTFVGRSREPEIIPSATG
jgi:uncharacterized glyoxalase superfamily protein PhnB